VVTIAMECPPFFWFKQVGRSVTQSARRRIRELDVGAWRDDAGKLRFQDEAARTGDQTDRVSHRPGCAWNSDDVPSGIPMLRVGILEDARVGRRWV